MYWDYAHNGGQGAGQMWSGLTSTKIKLPATRTCSSKPSKESTNLDSFRMEVRENL